jgi:hypothetical protein
MDRVEALPTRPVAVGQADCMKRTCDERPKPIALGKLHFYSSEGPEFEVCVPVTVAIAAHKNRLLD